MSLVAAEARIENGDPEALAAEAGGMPAVGAELGEIERCWWGSAAVAARPGRRFGARRVDTGRVEGDQAARARQASESRASCASACP